MNEGMPDCFRVYFTPFEVWLEAELHPTSEGLIVAMKRATRQVIAADRIRLAMGEVLAAATTLDDWAADDCRQRPGRQGRARIPEAALDAIADATWLDDEQEQLSGPAARIEAAERPPRRLEIARSAGT